MNSNRKKGIFRVLAALLILVVLIAVVGIILVGQCLLFDEDGAHVIDRYGVLAAEQNNIPQTNEVEQPTEQETHDDKAEPQTRIVVLPTDILLDTDERMQIVELAQNGMLNAVIVDIKDPDGYLNVYVSDDFPAQGDIDAFADAIRELRSSGISVIGRVYCLHDEFAIKQDADLAMQYDRGGIWMDYDRTHWLDPTNNGTIQYLSNTVQAAVQAGCDEILLADFTFPPRGHLDRVIFDRDPGSQAEILTDALQDIQHACGEVPVSLTADSVAGLTELSANGVEDGIPLGDIAKLLGTANRLLIPENDSDEAADSIAEVQKIVREAVIIPIFNDADTWLAYDGDAAIDLDEDRIADVMTAIE